MLYCRLNSFISQGLPDTSSTNLNQTSTAKEFWDNVELHMQGSGGRGRGRSYPTTKTSSEHGGTPPQRSEHPPTQGSHATVHECHMLLEPVQRMAPGNKMEIPYTGNFKEKALQMEAKEQGDVLDAEAEAFLAMWNAPHLMINTQALTTTNMFKPIHEGCIDSTGCGPNAAVAIHGANLIIPQVQQQSSQ
ncbi:hypothetical protein Tco_0352928 [Tanacetum coccineum]